MSGPRGVGLAIACHQRKPVCRSDLIRTAWQRIFPEPRRSSTAFWRAPLYWGLRDRELAHQLLPYGCSSRKWIERRSGNQASGRHSAVPGKSEGLMALVSALVVGVRNRELCLGNGNYSRGLYWSRRGSPR